MKPRFKHLPANTQSSKKGEKVSVGNRGFAPQTKNGKNSANQEENTPEETVQETLSNFSTIPPQWVKPIRGTLLALLFAVPQVTIPSFSQETGKKALAQVTGSCPAGTRETTLEWNNTNFQAGNFNQTFQIGGIDANFRMTENPGGIINDETPGELGPVPYGVANGPYGGINRRYLRWGIDARGNRTGGNATLTISFARPVTLAAPLRVLDVDRDRTDEPSYQDQITVTAANASGNVPVVLRGSEYNQATGNVVVGREPRVGGGNAANSESFGNVDVVPSGAVTQIQIQYESGPLYRPPNQDQTIGLADLVICAPDANAVGSIGDRVYRDDDRNNAQNGNEAGIEGVTVVLQDPNGQQIATTTTNAQGNYLFPNLPAGSYRVVIPTPPPGLSPTQTQPNPVALATGQNIETVDFGFAPAQVGSIGDRVYRDDDRNNTQNGTEPGIPDIPVVLQNDQGQEVARTTTNAQGNYLFPNLPAGSYRVVIPTPPAGLSPTQAQPNPVPLAAGQNIDTVDFGFAPGVGSIGDRVYRDDDRNNTQNGTEPGIPDIPVVLQNDQGQEVARTTTNAQGNYLFPNLPVGSYRVVIPTPPPGLSPTQTQPNPVPLAAGQNIDTVDFGFAPGVGSIGDRVYRDDDRNNAQNGNEAGIPDIPVVLQNDQGQEVARTTTNAQGNYSFPNLPAGSYRVVIPTPPPGLSPTQTQPNPVPLAAGQNIDTVDFGFAPGVGSIGDRVYRDDDRNNAQNGTEPGIPDIPVVLQNDQGQEVARTTTNAQGNYSFPNLPAGSYRVVIPTPPAGLSPTQTQPNPVPLAAGQNIDTVDFGFAPGVGSIGDRVYRDDDRNNAQNGTEPGIPDIPVVLQNDQGQEVARTTTNAQGNYSFPNLPAGSYRVVIPTPPPGLSPTQTQPNPVPLAAGQNIDTVDFGFAPGVGSIGDRVYRDDDRNNSQNGTEPGIPDIPVVLQNDQGQEVARTTTNAQGNYSFPNLPAGSYRVIIPTPPAGLSPTQTQPNPVPLAAGQNIDTVDFGFAPAQVGSIGDRVYRDDDRNNAQNGTEAGIPDIPVVLQNDQGQEVARTTTNAQGNYSFPNLPAGSYRVVIPTPPAGLSPTQTQPNPVPLAAGQNIDTVDFGFAPGVGSIGDRVYRDDDRNNTQNGTEPGIPDIPVVLQNDQGQEVARTTTNAQGNYSFPNLPAGSYRVVIPTPPAGLSPTQTQPNPVPLAAGQNIDTVDFGFGPGQGGSIGDRVFRDDDGNSAQNGTEPGIPDIPVVLQNDQGQEVARTTTNAQGNYSFPNLPAGSYRVVIPTPPAGLSPTQTQPNPVPLAAGQNIDTVDFGFGPGQGGSIGDRVFRDDDGNSAQNGTEPGIPDIPVVLQNDQGQEVARTTTNAQGNYSFPNLPAGSYRVVIPTPPAGLSPTQTQPNPVPLAAGQNIDTVDFGFGPGQGGSIGDRVFRDDDGNSAQNGTEPGIPDVPVVLQNEQGQEVARTTTDPQGNYRFNNIPPGNYRVVVPTAPERTTPTQTQPNPIPVAAGQSIDTVDFGFRPIVNGSIGDRVYRDENGNNTQDANEPGIGDVTVVLQDANGNEAGRLTTDAQGNYRFNNLTPGTYRLVVPQAPQGLTPTQAQPNPIPLEANQNIDTADFGFRPAPVGSIGDRVYSDDDGNSQQNGAEPGIPNIPVVLQNEQGQEVARTTTDPQGNYRFNNIPPGNYRVVIPTAPQGTTPTQTQPNPIPVATGQSIDTVDFGFRPGTVNGSIGDRVYRDDDGNNTQNGNEPGIGGVTVVLQDANGNEAGRQITDDQGNYSFRNLTPGTYSVVVPEAPQRFAPTQTQPNPIPLAAGQNIDTVDFGFRPGTVNGSIGDRVFRDDDGNSQQNGAEPGIPNVIVVLQNEQGQEVARTTTDPQGNYRFNNIAPGNYRIVVPTAPEQTNPTLTPGTITLAQGQNIDNVDFGFQPRPGGRVGADPGASVRLVKRVTGIFRNGERLPVPNLADSSADNGLGNSDAEINRVISIVGGGTTDSAINNPLRSGDEIEYTIYFLSNGNATAENVNFCDNIPQGTALNENTFGASRGIVLNQGGRDTSLTNSNRGDDAGNFFTPLEPLPQRNVCINSNNPDGTVTVNLGNLQPGSGGFIRFRVRVR